MDVIALVLTFPVVQENVVVLSQQVLTGFFSGGCFSRIYRPYLINAWLRLFYRHNLPTS
jgi:hypothetical protein